MHHALQEDKDAASAMKLLQQAPEVVSWTYPPQRACQALTLGMTQKMAVSLRKLLCRLTLFLQRSTPNFCAGRTQLSSGQDRIV